MARLIFSLVIFFLLVGCGGGSSSNSSSNDITKITKKNISGKTFNIKDFSNNQIYITTFNSDGTITGGGSKFSSDFEWKVSKTGELQTTYMLLGMPLTTITHKQIDYKDGCYIVTSTETYSAWQGKYELCSNQLRSQNFDEDSTNSHTNEDNITLVNNYQEKEGDSFTYNVIRLYNYSDGRNKQVKVNETQDYTKVDEIPEKYSYSNDIASPYLLETIKYNGKIAGYIYTSNSGETIISDDLSEYSSIDARTENYDKKGNSYKYSAEETLFDSLSGEEVAYSKLNMTCKAISREDITMLSKTFSTVKTICDYQWEYFKNNEHNTMVGKLRTWKEINNGILIKSTFDGQITLNENDTVNFSKIITLENYNISKNANQKTTKRNTLFRINKNKIFNSIQKDISSLKQLEVAE